MSKTYSDPRGKRSTRTNPSPDERSQTGERSVEDVLSELVAMLENSGAVSGAGTGSSSTRGTPETGNGTAPAAAASGNRSSRTMGDTKAPPLDALSMAGLDRGCILLPDWLKNLQKMPYAQGQIDKAIAGAGEPGSSPNADERAVWFLAPWVVAGGVWLAGELIEDDEDDNRAFLPPFPIILPIIIQNAIIEKLIEKFSSDDGERFVPAFIAVTGLFAAGLATGSTGKKLWKKYVD
ncbi:hypothetical protein K3723_19730 (plasmid) [Leisingera caerulea]|uniref:hypothetical protein n=1 Tax=Leisingera caerulea TaxID=506591 RepID=UPI0021A3AD9E|nr:hypothetical protein [Leisingera caerulea]UWQ65044.1 hypothetical protein K3723_19730 [Leisingera caerulea]